MSTFAKVFALADFMEQAEFLNEAGRTLRRCCETDLYADIQLCRIVDALDADGRALVESLAGFVASDKAKP